MKGREAVAVREVPVAASAAYRAFSRIEDLPRWFDHLAAVRRTGPRTSEWTLQGSPPRKWQVETTQDVKDQLYAWSSVEGTLVTYGSAHFDALGAARTRITLKRFHGVEKGTDAGHLTKAPLADPQRKLEADLDRFVQALAPRGPMQPVASGNFLVGAPPGKAMPSPRNARSPHGNAGAAPSPKTPAKAPAPKSPPTRPPPGGVTFQRVGAKPGAPKA